MPRDASCSPVVSEKTVNASCLMNTVVCTQSIDPLDLEFHRKLFHHFICILWISVFLFTHTHVHTHLSVFKVVGKQTVGNIVCYLNEKAKAIP